MTHVLFSVVSLLASVALLLTANGLLGVLLPVRALAQGFGSIELGVLGTAYFSGFFAGCLLGPRLVSRVGHIRAFAALASIVCAMTLVLALTNNSFVWIFSRGIIGIGLAGLYIVIESWLSEKSNNDNRGTVFSVYTIINLSVITAGQMAITLFDPQSFALFAIAAILISIATVPVTVSTAEAPASIAVSRLRLSYLFGRSRVAVVGCLGVGLANGAFWTLGPVFALSDNKDVSYVAIFMSLTVVSGVIGQWPLGKWSDRIDRRYVITVASIGASLGALALLATASAASPLLYIGPMVFGLFAFPLFPLCTALLNDAIEPTGYVEAASGLLIAYSIGAIIGPLIASTLISIAGAQSLFVYTAVVHLMIAAYTMYSLWRHRSAIVREKASFNDALVMTSLSAEIDPRPPVEEHA